MADSLALNRQIGMVATRFEQLDRVAEYGIRRVEFVILPSEEEPAVRGHLSRHRPQISVHCPLFRECGIEGYPLLAAILDTDQERQEAGLRLMERELLRAAEWSGTHLVVHLQRAVGILGEAVPPGWDRRRALDCAVKAGERIARAAEAAGVPVHVENMLAQPLLCRPEDYVAFFEELPAQWIRMCFDVGHAALEAAEGGFDLRQFAALMAPRIGSLHVYDNQVEHKFDFASLRDNGRLRKYPVRPDRDPAQGWIDNQGVLREVLSRNPDALVTFEVYFTLDTDRDETREGVQWIARLCQEYRGTVDGER